MTYSNITTELRTRVMKNFLDIFVLTELSDRALSGYEVGRLVHKKFDILVSSGTIYGLLYSLERQGLITGNSKGRKRVYQLTEKGEEDMDLIMKAKAKLRSFITDISVLKADE